MRRHFFIYAVSSFLFFLLSCGSAPSSLESDGSIDIVVLVENPNGEVPPIRETTWSKLVVRVSALDMVEILDTFDLDDNNTIHSISVSKIPQGTNRLVEAWTLDDDHEVIHGVDSQFVDIQAATVTQVLLELYPLKGSIYLVLSEIPTIIDTVVFSFSTGSTVWQTAAKRSPKLSLNLDKIPFNTTGALSIVGYNSIKDTVAFWKKLGFTFTSSNTSIQASFVSVGKIDLQVTIYIPGSTIIYGIMDTTQSIGDEIGGLIISEIMYSVNDSEYVEVYNPTATPYNDTVYLQKDNGACRAFDVSIGSEEFYVIGRRALPWADTYHGTTSALDLSSSTGNWLALRAKDSSLIDLVAFQGGSNKLQWPNVSSSTRASIELDSLDSNPEYNNFGKHWKQAKNPVDTSITKQLGSPGRPRL